jgi:hypothetical protein
MAALDDYNAMGGPAPEKALEMTHSLLDEAKFETILMNPTCN